MEVWLRMLLDNIGLKQYLPAIMHEDNAACIVLSRGEGKFLQPMHIGIKYHYLWEQIVKGEIVLQYNNTDDKLPEIPTKPRMNVCFKELMKTMVSDHNGSTKLELN